MGKSAATCHTRVAKLLLAANAVPTTAKYQFKIAQVRLRSWVAVCGFSVKFAGIVAQTMALKDP